MGGGDRVVWIWVGCSVVIPAASFPTSSLMTWATFGIFAEMCVLFKNYFTILIKALIL